MASPYDLDSFWFGGALKMPLGSNSRVKFAYDYYARSYDERRARDENGSASSSNPTIEYRYHVVELGIRHRFTDSVVTELTYSYTRRVDDFVGYNDYTRDRIDWKTSFDITDKIAASFELDYRDQQYMNAFAFDDPTQPQKEYQDLEVSVGGVYRFTDQLSLRAEIRQDTVTPRTRAAHTIDCAPASAFTTASRVSAPGYTTSPMNRSPVPAGDRY